ncbi:hypothetical protein ACFQ51_04120 [Streptomyces kaempferi]
MAASTTATLLLPALLARAVNQALGGAGTATGHRLIALLALLTVAEATAQYAAPRSGADAAARIRTMAIRRTLAAGPAAVARMPVGDLVARLTASAPQAALAAPALVYSAAQLLMAVVAVVALTLLSPCCPWRSWPPRPPATRSSAASCAARPTRVTDTSGPRLNWRPDCSTH